MTEIKINILFPGHDPRSVWVDQDDKIGEYLRQYFRERSIAASPDKYQYFKTKNGLPLQLNSTFKGAGFGYNDELIIREMKVLAVPNAYDSPIGPVALPNLAKEKGKEIVVIDDDDPIKETQTFHQLGIFILDGSGSMETKDKERKMLADKVNEAAQNFLAGFKEVNKSKMVNFSIAVITFDNRARIHTPITPLEKVNEKADYSPLLGHGGGTHINVALEEAERIANGFISGPEAKDIPHEVRFIIMSDGLCQAPDKTRAIANRIKQNTRFKIYTSLFIEPGSAQNRESVVAENILRDIASNPQQFATANNIPALIKFFLASMSTKRGR